MKLQFINKLFKKGNGIELYKKPSWFLYILPALVIYIMFMALPLISSLTSSLYTGKGFKLDTFVGFDNYIKLFTDDRKAPEFANAFAHTGVFFIVHMVVQNVLGLIFALILSNKGFKGAGAYRTIIFIPATLAIMVTGFLWKLLLDPYNGPLHQALTGIGIPIDPAGFLGDEKTSLVTIALVSSWQWIGIPTLIFTAAIQSIPDDYFEAAAIDGASPWQIIRYIKLPILIPTMIVVSILTFTGNFTAYDVVFAMEGNTGSPVGSTDILGTFFYRNGIVGKAPSAADPGLGAATATIMFIVLLIGVLFMQWISKKATKR